MHTAHTRLLTEDYGKTSLHPDLCKHLTEEFKASVTGKDVLIGYSVRVWFHSQIHTSLVCFQKHQDGDGKNAQLDD